MPNIFKPKRSTTASSVPTTGNLSDGELAVNLADRKIFVRNGASIVTVASDLVDGDKGDITVSSSGASWTIDSGVVTNAKLANVSTATIKGRTTAGTGSPEDLTGTQATALLDTFTTSLKGLAPASGGGTSNFLRADGTWAAPTVSSITGTVTGTNSTDLVYGNMADNDQFRIRIGGTASDSGFVEIATADNGTEPIYVRQYSGVFTTLTRTATLLDGSGNTSFPGSITGNTIVKSGGTSSQFLKADGSVDSNTYLTSASTLTAGNLSGTIPSGVLGNSSLFVGTTSIALNRASASQSLTGVSIDGNAGTVTNGFYTTSSFNLGTTSIAVNRASAAQSLTGINIDGSSGSCTGNAATATILQTTRTIWGQNFNGSANVTGALSGATDITASGTVKGNQVIGGTGSVIGSAGLIVNGTTGDNDSQLIIKKPSQSSFGVLSWDGQVFLSANIYYDNGVWVHSAPSLNTNNNMLVLAPGTGVQWYASNNSTGSWNVAGGTTLWNDSGVWQRSLSNTLTLNTSGTGLSGSTTYNNSGAATFTVTSNATNANTANAIVSRDASGNFSAGTITATLSGNATSATTATSATSAGSVTNSVTFNNGGAGAASGTTFNGSAAQTISYNTIGASPLAGSASLTTTGTVTSGTWSGSFGSVSGANLTNLTAGNLSGTIPSAVLGNSSLFVGTTSIALNRASAAQSLTGVNIDGSSGSCTGNAATATTLATARTINNVSFNGSANIVVPTIFDSNYYSIMNPGGAQYVTQTATVTGAIAITFPVGMTNSMVRMTIKVYEYATNESFEIHCGGYTYNVGNTWANNPFAYIIGNPDTDRRFSVRFGYTAAGRAIVYVGELASTWSYPQVFVTEVQVGYSGNSSTWSSGWAISFVTAAFENVTATISDCQTDYRSSSNTAKSLVYRDASNNFSAGTITATLSGNASTATTFSTGRTNYAGVTDGAVAGQLMWKNYGNNHTLFDASAGTSPQGGAVDRFTPANLVDSDTGQNTWGYSINLMGWNGTATYGVRVDYARASSRLFTTRTIWGQNFDGTGNVTGALTGVTNITASGTINLSADQALVNQNNGNAAAWYGRILSKNSTSDKASFLGTYGSIAGVFAHNNALNAWADLYVNTVDGSTGGAVRMPSSVLINGNQAIHAGNYNSYAPTLTGTGASGSWGISITGSSASCTGNAATATSATSAGSVTNSVTFNNGGAGAASGTTFNGSAAQTISYNTIGASPLAGSASLTTTGTVTSGTWSGSFGSVSGANLTNLTAGNLSGTIPSGVLGNSAHFIGTTSIALNRASAAQTLTGVSIDGNAATSTQLTTLDDRTISPSEITTGRLQFGFTSWNNNNTSPYADYLHLRSYTDGTGGNDNLVMFRKDAIGMRIWQQSYGSATAYASFKDVCWTDGTNATGTGWAISITGSSASCTGNAATATSATSATSAGSVTNSVTFNNAGTGAASGTTFNGSAAQTISYNTIGASPLAGSTSLTTTGTVTTGTWSGSFGSVSGANLTNLTAGNLSGTIPSGVLGNSAHFIGTTSIALNRASAAQALTGITSIDGSAATLTTTRTIWGQNFNGSANVTGALTGVTDITATGNVAVDGAFRAESSNSTERFDIYYNETTDSLDFDYLTV